MPNKWFNGQYYLFGQPFSTFARHERNREMLTARLKALVGKPSQSTALEVGPGDAPLLESLPFAERYYLDASPRLARDLKRMARASQGSKIIAADLRQLPFAEDAEFDVAVLNEVLTHLRPAERIPAVTALARHTRRLLIVDRHTTTEAAIRAEARRLAARMETASKQKGGTIKIDHSAFLDIPQDKIDEEMARRVGFVEIQDALEGQGYRVHCQQRVHRGTGYTVLTARRVE